MIVNIKNNDSAACYYFISIFNWFSDGNGSRKTVVSHWFFYKFNCLFTFFWRNLGRL